MKRSSLRRVLTSFLAVIVFFSSVFVSDAVSGIREVSAETNSKNAVGNEEKDTEDTPVLVEDSQDSSVYYNSNSSIQDFRDETIYFVMTTRFYDGDSSNNVQCWDAQEKNANDPPWRGDFKGLIEKLDYIKALGFTAIWITPVVENASGYDYHGYHAINFSKVDPRYESSDCTYQDLINAIHAKGMKVIQDVVFNHTGNWGEENLYGIASKDYSADLSDCEKSMVINYDYAWDEVAKLLGGKDYAASIPETQFQTRVRLLGQDAYDKDKIYHHDGGLQSWETYDEQVKNIAGDCIDLNTENPKVYKYLVEAYSKYIKMGVDAFRVDTVKHISRLTYNKALIAPLNEAYNETHGTTGEGNFFMFGEVCTRVRDVWNHDMPCISCPFFTWKERKDYAWDDSDTLAAAATNRASVDKHFEDNRGINDEPTSNNAKLQGNSYHTPDYSKASGLNVIDFPMHWNFQHARDAFRVAVEKDQYYNDATFNVTYVDSHDYAPDGAPENQRFAGTTGDWAENLSLMFTFRGIPCIYYGSEVEFQKGKPIDVGTTAPLAETGRAYFGDYIEGSVDVVDFARYSNATGKMAETLNNPLSLHIQRLNRLRAAIPALRKGQYSTDGCSSDMSYKRRYTDSTTDSFALITISGDATFSGIPNGKYTDAITGDVQNVSNGSLSTTGVKGQGDLRVYVLDTDLTQAPGMIDGYSKYMSGGKDVEVVEAVKPTGISLDKTSASLDLGETVKFTATVAPADATNKTVKWKSSDTSVATVSGSGQVTAKGEGTATIYAATSNATSFEDNSSLVAKATVTVKASGVRVTSLSLSRTSVTLEGGESVTITTTILPPNADSKYAAITWTSSDTSVAKVNSTGVITGVKQGKATVTATTMDGVSAKVEVEVKGTVIYGNAIYFEKPSDWGNKINMYMWSSDVPKWENAEWPGVAMTLIDEEKGIYGIEWPEGKSNLNVIFNDGGNKTDDLTNAKMNGYYNKEGLVREEPTIEQPSDESTKPSDESTRPSDESTKPSDESTKPSDESTKPSDESTKPSDESTKPSDESTKPSDESTKPSDESTKPSDESTKPSDESTKPSDESTKPSDESTKPSGESTKPSDESTKPSDESTKPSEDPTEPPVNPVKDLKIKSFTASVASGMLEKGKSVKLKASAQNAQGTAKYRFTVKRNNTVTMIQNYSTRSYVNWKPSKSGKYTLTVYVKDDYRVVKKSISNYTVNDTLKISSFKASVGSKKASVGKKIKLTSKAAGGTKSYMYKFSYKLGNKAKTISGYSKKSSVNWTPKAAGTYQLRVYVKDTKTGKVVSKIIKKYVVKGK